MYLVRPAISVFIFSDIFQPSLLTVLVLAKRFAIILWYWYQIF